MTNLNFRNIIKYIIYHGAVRRHFKCGYSDTFIRVKKKKIMKRSIIPTRHCDADINNIVHYGNLPYCRENVYDFTNKKYVKSVEF